MICRNVVAVITNRQSITMGIVPDCELHVDSSSAMRCVQSVGMNAYRSLGCIAPQFLVSPSMRRESGLVLTKDLSSLSFSHVLPQEGTRRIGGRSFGGLRRWDASLPASSTAMGPDRITGYLTLLFAWSLALPSLSSVNEKVLHKPDSPFRSICHNPDGEVAGTVPKR